MSISPKIFDEGWDGVNNPPRFLVHYTLLNHRWWRHLKRCNQLTRLSLADCRKSTVWAWKKSVTASLQPFTSFCAFSLRPVAVPLTWAPKRKSWKACLMPFLFLKGREGLRYVPRQPGAFAWTQLFEDGNKNNAHHQRDTKMGIKELAN